MSQITSASYASFLVRLWREEEPETPESAADWQSEIQHIQTGQRYTLTLDQLLEFLRQQTQDGAGLD